MTPLWALDGNPSPAVSGWILALSAAAGVLVSLLVVRWVAARGEPSNARPQPLTPTYPVSRPMRGPAGTASRYISLRLGRRGTLLTLFGLAYGTYGAGQFLSGPVTRFGNLGPLSPVVNTHAIGWVWVVGGLTGVVIGLRPRKQSDGAGFVGVFIPLMTWTVLYDISWIVGLATGGEYGNPRAWVTSIVWTVQTAVVVVTAGWPDPEVDADRVNRE